MKSKTKSHINTASSQYFSFSLVMLSSLNVFKGE